jgi:hypothetical protein
VRRFAALLPDSTTFGGLKGVQKMGKAGKGAGFRPAFWNQEEAGRGRASLAAAQSAPPSGTGAPPVPAQKAREVVGVAGGGVQKEVYRCQGESMARVW